MLRNKKRLRVGLQPSHHGVQKLCEWELGGRGLRVDSLDGVGAATPPRGAGRVGGVDAEAGGRLLPEHVGGEAAPSESSEAVVPRPDRPRGRGQGVVVHGERDGLDLDLDGRLVVGQLLDVVDESVLLIGRGPRVVVLGLARGVDHDLHLGRSELRSGSSVR